MSLKAHPLHMKRIPPQPSPLPQGGEGEIIQKTSGYKIEGNDQKGERGRTRGTFQAEESPSDPQEMGLRFRLDKGCKG
jgi:hypothetical protein